MELILDLSEEERQIFLAEANEQLQILDEGLVQLEQNQADAAQLEAIFRAGHTLKGNAGMIGHQRMVDLTHALETVLDGLRKSKLTVSVPLIDACLDAVDTLRLLNEEIAGSQPQAVDLAPLLDRLKALQLSDQPENPPRLGEFLVAKGYITEADVEAALEHQKSAPGKVLLGQVLVQQGLITQEILDQAIIELIAQLQNSLRERKSTAPSHTRARVTESTVRTSVERLDELMNLVGELITDRNRLNQIHLKSAHQPQNGNHFENLAETVAHIGRITDQLQENVMSIRLLPIENVFNKFPRLARDLALKADKQVNLVIEGADTELDRSVLDLISDPIVHLLRNAIDHGIEPLAERIKAGKPQSGTILLSARHERGQIVITVKDDGRGIDARKIKGKAVSKGILSQAEADVLSDDDAIDLIFRSGLSTAETISEISGRGVGMDIVRTNIDNLNGSILVETSPGEGTQFQIMLPLTLAIMPTLLVQIRSNVFAIPLIAVAEILRVPPEEIQKIKGRPAILRRETVLPLVRLGEALGFQDGASNQPYENVVSIQAGKMQMGLAVDAFIREEELMVKSLGFLDGKISYISGAAILGDGRIALVLDISSMGKLAGEIKPRHLLDAG